MHCVWFRHPFRWVSFKLYNQNQNTFHLWSGSSAIDQWKAAGLTPRAHPGTNHSLLIPGRPVLVVTRHWITAILSVRLTRKIDNFLFLSIKEFSTVITEISPWSGTICYQVKFRGCSSNVNCSAYDANLHICGIRWTTMRATWQICIFKPHDLINDPWMLFFHLFECCFRYFYHFVISLAINFCIMEKQKPPHNTMAGDGNKKGNDFSRCSSRTSRRLGLKAPLQSPSRLPAHGKWAFLMLIYLYHTVDKKYPNFSY